jgi:predicted S18 family serine protease
MSMVGQTRYIGTEATYYGRARIARQLADGTYVAVLKDGRKARVAADQVFLTAREAKDNARQHIIWNR